MTPKYENPAVLVWSTDEVNRLGDNGKIRALPITSPEFSEYMALMYIWFIITDADENFQGSLTYIQNRLRAARQDFKNMGNKVAAKKIKEAMIINAKSIN